MFLLKHYKGFNIRNVWQGMFPGQKNVCNRSKLEFSTKEENLLDSSNTCNNAKKIGD